MRATIISPCRDYRYVLWRQWDSFDLGFALFVGLNPSTADETNDDPTIRRCVSFARSWGFGSLCMVNLFAFRAAKPGEMLRCVDPVGRDNDATIQRLSSEAATTVAAWGAGDTRGRDKAVFRLLTNPYCLGLTKDGHPRHPLYVRSDQLPAVFGLREAA